MTQEPIGRNVAVRVSSAAIVDLMSGWSSDGSLYRSLADELQRLIETGFVPTGSTLPSERDLASAIHVSRNTVAAAYAELRRHGLAESRRGSGTVIAPSSARPGAAHKIDGMFASSIARHRPEVDLTLAAPDCAPQVAEALRCTGSLLDELAPDWQKSHGYSALGLPAFRTAIAEHYTQRFHLATSPDQVIVTSGAQQAIDVIFAAFGTAGGTMVIEDPTFPGAIDLMNRHALRPITVSAGGQDIDRLEHILTTHRPRLVYLST